MRIIDIRINGRWIEALGGSMAHGDLLRLAGVTEENSPKAVRWKRFVNGGKQIEEGVLVSGDVIRATNGMIFDVEEVGS